MAHPRIDVFDDGEPMPKVDASGALKLDDLDWTLSLSTLLKVGTAVAHERTENTRGASMLAHGQLDKDEYVRYLIMLWHVYDTMEAALDKHANSPTLAPTYLPTLLARASPLKTDISYHFSTSDFTTHPRYAAFRAAFPRSLTTYLDRLREISSSDEPERLLAHAYVRYLGDLSGGQFIRRRLMKAYDLPDSGEGSTSFDFGTLDGSGEGRASMAEMKKIKIWYRDGMNAGAGDDEALKRRIVDEADLAFELNTGLFDELREPGAASPSTPVANGSNGHAVAREEEPYSPLMTKSQLLAAEGNMRDQERSAAGSMVVSLLTAAALSYLALTLFGLSGQTASSNRIWMFADWIWQNARSVVGSQ